LRHCRRSEEIEFHQFAVTVHHIVFDLPGSDFAKAGFGGVARREYFPAN